MANGLDEIYAKIVELRPLYKNSDISGLYAYRKTLRSLMEEAFAAESLKIDMKITKRKQRAKEQREARNKKLLGLDKYYQKKRQEIEKEFNENIQKLGFVSQQDIECIDVSDVHISGPTPPLKHEIEEIEDSDDEGVSGIELSPSF